MARVYSDRLLAVSESTTGSATVPDGFIWVVRDIVAFWDGSSDPSLELANLSISPSTLVLDWIAVGSGGARVVEHWEGRQVITTGETLTWGSTTDTWFVMVSGYVLALP